jgi:hypothetical protein
MSKIVSDTIALVIGYLLAVAAMLAGMALLGVWPFLS